MLPLVPFSSRAVTLPDLGHLDAPTTFVVPELPQETLLEKEHNETLAKLNFVLAVSECVMEVAVGRPRAESLVLLYRALQLLHSGLSLATSRLREQTLQPSPSVKKVVSSMNCKFRKCLNECKLLNANSPNLTQHASANADKILYNHAITMCQSAALDELFDNSTDCFQRYQTAHILLHSLAQTVSYQQDRELLKKYKVAVERRLSVLQKQGVVYANSTGTEI